MLEKKTETLGVKSFVSFLEMSQAIFTQDEYVCVS